MPSADVCVQRPVPGKPGQRGAFPPYAPRSFGASPTMALSGEAGECERVDREPFADFSELMVGS